MRHLTYLYALPGLDPVATEISGEEWNLDDLVRGLG